MYSAELRATMNMGWFLMEEFEALLQEQSLPEDNISVESRDGGKLKVLLKNNVQITGVHSAKDWDKQTQAGANQYCRGGTGE